MSDALELGRGPLTFPAARTAVGPARSVVTDPALVETIRRVVAGDQDPFARLYNGYARMVRAILLGRVPPKDIDDLLQDVFVTVFKRLRELREPAAFGSWIAAIARNRATDYLRQAREHAELPAELPGGEPI